MRVHNIAQCFVIPLLGIVILGCQNQQPVIDNLTKQKEALEKQVEEAESKTSQLETDKATLQTELDSAKRAAEDANVALSAEKQRADAASKAAQDAQTQAAATDKAAQQQLAEAKTKVADLQKQLDEAELLLDAYAATAGEATVIVNEIRDDLQWQRWLMVQGIKGITRL